MGDTHGTAHSISPRRPAPALSTSAGRGFARDSWGLAGGRDGPATPGRRRCARTLDERGRLAPRQADTIPARANGRRVTTGPPARATALATAGASGGTPGSPTPVGAAVLGTMNTSTAGIS